MSATHWRKILFWRHYKRALLPHQVVVITGASSGIGQELARQYSRKKICLVLAARSKEALEQVAEEVRENGSKVLVVPTDVTSEEQCAQLMEKTMDAFGRIDILVLNAGIGCHQVFTQSKDLSAFRRLMEVNFFGYLHCTKHAMPHLSRSRGVILVVSSLSGEMGLPFRTAYCASKFAVTGFFESLRTELVVLAQQRKKVGRGSGQPEVDICIVCPPTVNTALRQHSLTAPGAHTSIPDEKAMSVEECAGVIIDTGERRLRKVYFPLVPYLGVYIRPFFPDLVDYMANRRAAKL